MSYENGQNSIYYFEIQGLYVDQIGLNFKNFQFLKVESVFNINFIFLYVNFFKRFLNMFF